MQNYTSTRRDWLKQGTLAAFGLGLNLHSLGNEERLPRSFGAENGLINLGSNENPYGISPKAKEAIIAHLGVANRYPFNVASVRNFKKELGDYYNIAEENLLITPGSGMALDLFAHYYSKGNLVTAIPTFFILPGTAKRLGTKVIEVPLTPEKVHDLPGMLSAITPDTQLVYICNPANPTATIVHPNQLRDFCVEASKKTTVLIDEAYIDFLDAPDNVSMLSLIHDNQNILVMRTFSKIHAMAGMRVGFTMGHPALVKKLHDEVFDETEVGVTVLSQAAALASLKDEAHRQMCKQKNAAARQYTYDELSKLKYKVTPSHTNFMFFEMGNFPGDFAEEMLKKKVIVRSMNNPTGKYGRVSMGTMDEMKEFIRLMKAP
jgi:histidinol-phosphate aminotransferase